ncbi:MAG: endolytic transglycosylase MltG [Oscillospiraceae bacterium]
MKKIINIFFTIILCLSIVGCSNSDNTTITPIDISSQMESSSVTEESSIKETSSEAISSENASSKQSVSKAPVETPKTSSTPAKVVVPSSEPPKPTSSAPLVKETVSLTFMEGSSLAKMMDVLDQYGIAKRTDLLKVVNGYDFGYYPLVGEITASSERCFKLEGYLFPDTYQFYKGEKPEDAIGRFLKVTEKKLTKEYRDRAATLGYSVDQIITIASIIEKEIGDVTQMSTVASIFYNRLSQGQKLQSDATINYVERSIKPYIEGDINRYNSFYNTYKCSALPAGPICNPGVAAIKAALYPEQTEYLFFASDKAGNYYFASSYEEHLANCVTAGITTE